MGISLYATRIVLNTLGATDYGIFNLISGVITMLSFLNTSMAISTQRFLSFYQGRDNPQMQKKVFANSLMLHFLIGIIIVAGLEIAAFFIFDGFLNIPKDRIDASKTVYQFMAATVFFTIIAVPFIGSLTAHENMIWIAVVTTVETILKLGIAFFLTTISTDKLIVFGILTALISVISFFLYCLYCLRKYEECTFKGIYVIDKKLIKELASFAGWNSFGALCGISRNEGLAIVLNLFKGVVVNTAYGIANQVSSQMVFFSVTMLRVLNPQIMKSEGAGDRNRMLRLSMMASKFGFFLLAIFAIPCIFEMNNILLLWLKKVPENAVVFCDLILIGALANQLTIGLQSAIQATGKIKGYQFVVGSVILLNVPFAYILLKMGLPTYSIFICFIFIELIACCLRLFFLKRLAGLSIREYISRVFLKEIIPLMFSIVCCFLMVTYVDLSFRVILTCIFSGFIFIISIYFFGMEVDEKVILNTLINKIIGLVKKKYISD